MIKRDFPRSTSASCGCSTRCCARAASPARPQALETSQPAVSQILSGCARALPIRFSCATAAACSRPRARSRWRRRSRALLATADSSGSERVPFDPEDVGPPVQPAADRRRHGALPAAADRARDGRRAAGADPRGAARLRAISRSSSRPARPILRSAPFPTAAGYLRRQRLFSDGYVSVVRKRPSAAARGCGRARAFSPSVTS